MKVSDVATVVDGFKEEDLYSRYDGHPAIVLNIFRTGNEDTLRLAKLVREFVAEKHAHVPKGVDLEIWNDESVLLQGRIHLLLEDGFQGFLLVYLALALFLRPGPRLPRRPRDPDRLRRRAHRAGPTATSRST